MTESDPVPAVSVVVTCYNLERYIGEAIESVLAQDGAGPLEVIVVDDCSTDGSRDVISRYPVRLVRAERNGGVLNAMLLGLAAASADIVCLLDGDDRWRCDKLAKIRKAFAEDPELTFLTHDLNYIDSGGNLLDVPSRVSEVMGAAPPEEWPRLVREGILSLGDHVWLGSAFCFRASGVRLTEFHAFAEALPDPANTYQDWPLATWIAAQPDTRCGYLPEKLFDYRVHGANHSGDSRTPERAARNWRRAALTLSAQTEILHRFHGDEGYRASIARRAEVSQMFSDLYSGRGRRRALGKLLRNRSERAAKGTLAKDVVRVALLSLLGPKLGTRLIHRLARS